MGPIALKMEWVIRVKLLTLARTLGVRGKNYGFRDWGD